MNHKLVHKILAASIVATAIVAPTPFDQKAEAANTPLKDTSAGSIVTFAGKEWIVLNPSTGYILMKDHLSSTLRAFDPDNTQRFDPNDQNNIAYELNYTFFNSLPVAEREWIQRSSWTIGAVPDGYDVIYGSMPLSTLKGYEDDATVEANIGLLSLSEWRQYSKRYGGAAGILDNPDVTVWTWTRNSDSTTSNEVWFLNNEGGMVSNRANAAFGSVRPALYLESGLFVSDNGTIISNTKPTATTISHQTTTIASNQTVDVSPYFTDVDGDALTYTTSSSNSTVATTAVNGNVLTITSASAGATTITVTAEDGKGGQVSATFEVTVTATDQPPSNPTPTDSQPISIPNPAALTGTGSIAITVLHDDKRTPVTEPLQVKIIDKSGRIVTNTSDTLPATGTFTSSTKLAKGTYYVTISDGKVDQTTGVSVTTKPVSVKLVWEATLQGLKDNNGAVKKSGAITGIVYDSTTDTAKVMADATVKVVSKKTTWSTKTNKSGSFTLYVPAGTYDVIIEGKDSANVDDKKNSMYKKVKVTAGQASAPLQPLNATLNWETAEKSLGFVLTESSLTGKNTATASKAFTGKALAYSTVSAYTLTSSDTVKTWVAEAKTKKNGDFSVKVPILAGERVLFKVQDEAGNVYESDIKQVSKIDAPTLSASASRGDASGTTKISVKPTRNTDNKILVIVSTATTSTPKLGDAAPTTSDSAIAFVADYESKKELNVRGATYAAVYEVSTTGKIVKFKDISLSGKIKE